MNVWPSHCRRDAARIQTARAGPRHRHEGIQPIAGGAPGSASPYVAIANLTFDSVPVFEAAFGPHAKEIMADIPRYTSIEPIIQISEVKMGA